MKGSIFICFVSVALLLATTSNAATEKFWQETDNGGKPRKEKKAAKKIPVKKEKTTFQTGGPRKPTTDTRSDAAIVYGARAMGQAIVLRYVPNHGVTMDTTHSL